jgi:predicted GNAT superfamily acetyltransferase
VAAGKTAGTEAAVNGDPVVIRKCQRLDEMQACVRLQKAVWGFSDADLVPLRLFVVAEKVGGQVIGAFAGDQMVGFALAIPGYRNRKPYLHSHMLAVSQQLRNAGLGRRIKLFQREDALEKGVDLIEWTFDPLEIKNAYLNIEKLGAIARRYIPNQYGITSSPLQGGLPTDRLVAEWWLNSSRVIGLLNAGATPETHAEITIAVPGQISEWKSSVADKSRALKTQNLIREDFENAFRQSLAVVGYQRDHAGNGTFLLGRWNPELAVTSNNEN